MHSNGLWFCRRIVMPEHFRRHSENTNNRGQARGSEPGPDEMLAQAEREILDTQLAKYGYNVQNR